MLIEIMLNVKYNIQLLSYLVGNLTILVLKVGKYNAGGASQQEPLSMHSMYFD